MFIFILWIDEDKFGEELVFFDIFIEVIIYFFNFK